MDLIYNGQASGSVASRLLQNGMNPNILRPWLGKDGRSRVAVWNQETGKYAPQIVQNANATLKYNEWRLIDDAVTRVAKERLTVVQEIRSRGLVYNLPNGMAHTILTTQRMGDITPATVSMEPARRSERDRPEFDLLNLPLPIVHKDFGFTARQIAVSRNGGAPLDTTMVELATRRVAEEVEALTLGTAGTFTFGGASVYGFVNFPQRLTYSLTPPTSGSWNPQKTVNDILAMRQIAANNFYFGPYTLFMGTGWDTYLDSDYIVSGSISTGGTLRERILKTNMIDKIVPAYYLTGYQIVLVQMTSDVVREVVGMDATTLQWEEQGGMEINFKVMAMIIPHLRADQNNQTGIVHGS
jgi:uncharacterized linocin/CFP29 family protein